jgi:fatty acid desaturase
MAWFLLYLRALIARRGFQHLREDIEKERAGIPNPDRPATIFFLLAFIVFLAWLVADGMHVERWIVGALLFLAIVLAGGGVIAAARAGAKPT